VKQLIVSLGAKADLREIRDFSTKRWGREQARNYIDLIIARFAWIMVNASRGARCEELLPALRRVNVRRHAIFYRDFPDRIEISRVLHQRMDHARAFDAERDDAG
jgi:toxin ParE1/3/4